MPENPRQYIFSRRTFLASCAAASLVGCSAEQGVAKGEKKDIMPRFGVITDLHYADREPANTRYYRESQDKLQECVALMNEEKVDFLLELGDLKDESATPEEASTLEYLRIIDTTFKTFQGPHHYVMGNHDLDQISKAQFKSITGLKDTYYSFDMKGIHFVILDACFNSEGKDYNHGNFKWWDANIPQSQIEWLAADLAKTKVPTIVFVHQLLDGDGTHHVNNAEEVRKVLEDSEKVLAVFQGHYHDGSYQVINGIHYYTIPAAVEGSGPENSAYVIMKVQNNGDINMTGYRRVEDQVLYRGGKEPEAAPVT